GSSCSLMISSISASSLHGYPLPALHVEILQVVGRHGLAELALADALGVVVRHLTEGLDGGNELDELLRAGFQPDRDFALCQHAGEAPCRAFAIGRIEVSDIAKFLEAGAVCNVQRWLRLAELAEIFGERRRERRDGRSVHGRRAFRAAGFRLLL